MRTRKDTMRGWKEREKQMNKTPEEHGLKVGGRFKVIYTAIEKDGKEHVSKVRKGTVLGIYPHVFLAQIDGRKYIECFRNETLESCSREIVRPL